jgi:hypothetical protein
MRYLAQFHKIIPGSIRRILSREVSILILNDGGIDMISIDPIPVIQYLDLINGFRYTICLYIMDIEESIKCYYRKDHRDPEILSQRDISLDMNSSFPLFFIY